MGLTKKYINGYLNQPYSLFYKRKSSDFTRSIVYEIQSLTASIDLLLNLFTELFIAAGITIGFGTIGSGLGAGLPGSAAMKGIGKQPRNADSLTVHMIIGQAVTQTSTIFSLILASTNS